MAEVTLNQSDFDGELREQLFDDCVSLYCGFVLNLTDDDRSYLDWIGDRYEITTWQCTHAHILWVDQIHF